MANEKGNFENLSGVISVLILASIVPYCFQYMVFSSS